MKLPLITILLATNVIVGMACYSLGFARQASSPSALHAKKNYASILSHLDFSPADSFEIVDDSPTQPNVQSLPHLRAVTGLGVRERLGQLLAETETMEAEDVLAALKESRHLPGSPDQLMAQQLLLARYAELDPETALSYVDSLDGFNHEMSALTVMSTWAAEDPEQASRYFEENADDFGILDEDQGVAAGTIASEWAAQDPDGALTWADGLPEELRVEAFGRIMAQLANADPGEAAQVLEAIESGAERAGMLETMVDQWAHQDPAAAADWVLQNTDGSDGLTAVTSLVNAWMLNSPMEASQWLGDLPSGAMKDNGILTLTESRFVQRDPEAQVAWSSVIQDPSMRDVALSRAVAGWQTQDPEALGAWLAEQR